MWVAENSRAILYACSESNQAIHKVLFQSFRWLKNDRFSSFSRGPIQHTNRHLAVSDGLDIFSRAKERCLLCFTSEVTPFQVFHIVSELISSELSSRSIRTSFLVSHSQSCSTSPNGSIGFKTRFNPLPSSSDFIYVDSGHWGWSDDFWCVLLNWMVKFLWRHQSWGSLHSRLWSSPWPQLGSKVWVELSMGTSSGLYVKGHHFEFSAAVANQNRAVRLVVISDLFLESEPLRSLHGLFHRNMWQQVTHREVKVIIS